MEFIKLSMYFCVIIFCFFPLFYLSFISVNWLNKFFMTNGNVRILGAENHLLMWKAFCNWKISTRIILTVWKRLDFYLIIKKNISIFIYHKLLVLIYLSQIVNINLSIYHWFSYLSQMVSIHLSVIDFHIYYRLLVSIYPSLIFISITDC